MTAAPQWSRAEKGPKGPEVTKFLSTCLRRQSLHLLKYGGAGEPAQPPTLQACPERAELQGKSVGCRGCLECHKMMGWLNMRKLLCPISPTARYCRASTELHREERTSIAVLPPCTTELSSKGKQEGSTAVRC